MSAREAKSALKLIFLGASKLVFCCVVIFNYITSVVAPQSLLSLAKKITFDRKTDSKVTPKSGIKVVLRIEKIDYAGEFQVLMY